MLDIDPEEEDEEAIIERRRKAREKLMARLNPGASQEESNASFPSSSALPSPAAASPVYSNRSVCILNF